MSWAHRLHLPYPPLLRRALRHSLLAWLLARLMYVIVLMVGVLFFSLMPFEEGIAAALHPTWGSRLLLVAVTCFLVWRDRRTAREHLLPANFGVAPAWFLGASVLSATLSDLALQAIVSLL